MTKTIVSLFILCLLSNCVCAQSMEEKEVADRVETLRNVMIHPDEAVLKDIAADELVYVHSSGTVRDKDALWMSS